MRKDVRVVKEVGVKDEVYLIGTGESRTMRIQIGGEIAEVLTDIMVYSIGEETSDVTVCSAVYLV